MKTSRWILPLLTAIAVGVWITSREREISAVESGISVLRERVHQAKIDADAEARRNPDGGRFSKDGRRPINWKEIAGKLGTGDGPDEMRMMVRMQRLLHGLTAEELCGELEKLATADMDQRARRKFESMIFSALVEKDPKLALEHAGDRLADEDDSRQFSRAFGKWAESDPAAASAWLDKQITAGVFAGKSLDGSNRIYTQYESGLIGVLFQSNLNSAVQRLAAVPENLRGAVFNNGLFQQVKPANEGDFVALVREAGGDANVKRILSQYAANLVQGQDFERVDHFISTARSTPDEKAAMVAAVMNRSVNIGGSAPLSVEVIDKVRTWAATQAPDLVDKQTGAMIAASMWVVGGKIENVAETVMKYHAASGNDDTLVAFLTNESVLSKVNGQEERALELAGKIKDPAKREEVIQMIHGKDRKP